MYEELLKTLRWIAGNDEICFSAEVAQEAKVAIESLTAENTAKDAEIERLQADLTRVTAERDAEAERYKRKCRDELAAVKCIGDVETYLELGSAKFIKRTIEEWRSSQDGGGQ